MFQDGSSKPTWVSGQHEQWSGLRGGSAQRIDSARKGIYEPDEILAWLERAEIQKIDSFARTSRQRVRDAVPFPDSCQTRRITDRVEALIIARISDHDLARVCLVLVDKISAGSL
jgi:hypothetical protein